MKYRPNSEPRTEQSEVRLRFVQNISHFFRLSQRIHGMYIDDFPVVARSSFFKGNGGLLAGSTQSKQWRIELLYRYKRAKTSRITLLNIRKLYFYLFTLNCMFTLSWARQFLRKMMQAQHFENRLLDNVRTMLLLIAPAAVSYASNSVGYWNI